MQIHTINHRSSHHAKYSGYDCLLNFITSDIISSKSRIIPYRLAKKISNNCNQDYGIYDSNSVFKDIKLFKKLVQSSKSKRLVHYLHAERDIRYTVKHRDLFSNTSFCGTFHKPPSVLKTQIKNTKYLEKINKVIAVGHNQVQFIQNWLDISDVTYIPHGVDTEFFIPSLKKNDKKSLLFVGQHLRDFDALNYCIPIIADKIRDLKVNVILREDFNHKIKPHKSIEVHNKINDDELKKYYQESSILFLPLLDATACNSILEGLACGIPVITSLVGGNKIYLEKSDNILLKSGDYEAFIETTIMCLKNEDKLLRMKESSRTLALSYDWRKIAQKTIQVYHDN